MMQVRHREVKYLAKVTQLAISGIGFEARHPGSGVRTPPQHPGARSWRNRQEGPEGEGRRPSRWSPGRKVTCAREPEGRMWRGDAQKRSASSTRTASGQGACLPSGPRCGPAGAQGRCRRRASVPPTAVSLCSQWQRRTWRRRIGWKEGAARATATGPGQTVLPGHRCAPSCTHPVSAGELVRNRGVRRGTG